MAIWDSFKDGFGGASSSSSEVDIHSIWTNIHDIHRFAKKDAVMVAHISFPPSKDCLNPQQSSHKSLRSSSDILHRMLYPKFQNDLKRR